VSEQVEEKRCPECGNGVLVGVTFREGGTADADEPIQAADSRQVETYSCGHEVVGPPLDRSATAESALDVERRTSEETAEPA
jgi:hypothetical protein